MRRTIRTSSTRFFFSNHLSVALFALALAVSVLSPAPAWAATILVQSGADDGTAVPGNCPGADCRLRDAIESAAAGDVIQFASDYTIPIVDDLSIDKNVTIDGAGHSVILDGPGASCGEEETCPLLVVGSSDSGATLTLNNLTLTEGYGRDAGGAILNYATILINNCAFSDNYSDNMGGAIYNFGTAAIANSTFVNNTAGWGGAIMNSGIVWSGANITISNSTFVGNTATTGSNLATCGTGGAVGLMLRNTLVANPLGGGANCYTEGSALTDGGHNLDDGASCGFAPANGSLNNTNPQLGAFSNYGGGTQTLALLSGSPAIGAGDNTVCVAVPVNGKDQRGITRDTACDIGAFEVETSQTGPAFTVNIAVDHNGDICSDDDCTLREAINTANTLSGANTITFAGSYTIALASELLIESELTIDGAGHAVTVSGNDTTRVFTIAAPDPEMVRLNDLNIVNGNSADGSGSGIRNVSSLTVTNSTFSGNSASSSGGGILNFGPLTVANSTFSGNDAGAGGGICHCDSTLVVTNSTFFDNSASEGGGIASLDALTVTNSTFSGNSAAEGGSGIFTAGAANIRNTILANSTTGDHCDNHGGEGTFIDGGGNLEDSVSCGLSQLTSLSNTDPLLGSPDNYGGSTETLSLLPGSPAMNATTANCPATDQRGVTRGSTCDSGAFESQGFTLSKTGGDNQSTLISTTFANPLAVSVTSAFSEPVNGGQVTFTPPISGASAVITGSPATITGGAASVTATANATIGAYTVTAGTAGATSVDFALINTVFYTLTYNAGSGGTISGTSPQTVAHGASGTPVTAEPNTGYHFVQWSDGVLTASRTDRNVTADITVTAEFEADQPSGNSYLLWTK